ncbi:hypothetical protein ABT272_42785 [Streptomyces sp900105245]|uniref:Transposase n=1 Tax=Streptomyces sp. 900105245 TaxID=3154379 RepID=A0ABV1UKS0_9ACTN
MADKTYSSRCFYVYQSKRSRPHILEMNVERRNRHNQSRRGGQPAALNRDTYRRRYTLERCFNQLKALHGITTRKDKTAVPYETAASLALFLLWATAA